MMKLLRSIYFVWVGAFSAWLAVIYVGVARFSFSGYVSREGLRYPVTCVEYDEFTCAVYGDCAMPVGGGFLQREH
jgi:hypothetical protein